jgi:hypothetical protein
MKERDENSWWIDIEKEEIGKMREKRGKQGTNLQSHAPKACA